MTKVFKAFLLLSPQNSLLLTKTYYDPAHVMYIAVLPQSALDHVRHPDLVIGLWA